MIAKPKEQVEAIKGLTKEQAVEALVGIFAQGNAPASFVLSIKDIAEGKSKGKYRSGRKNLKKTLRSQLADGLPSQARCTLRRRSEISLPSRSKLES